MSLTTLNTILNTAPLIIQGATRLIKLIRDQDDGEQAEIPATLEGIKHEVERINQRLDANSNADVEQIKLIEELAKQNESLATQLKATITKLNRLAVVALVSLILAAGAVFVAVAN